MAVQPFRSVAYEIPAVPMRQAHISCLQTTCNLLIALAITQGLVMILICPYWTRTYFSIQSIQSGLVCYLWHVLSHLLSVSLFV